MASDASKIRLYYRLVKEKRKSITEVPLNLRARVRELLQYDEYNKK